MKRRNRYGWEMPASRRDRSRRRALVPAERDCSIAIATISSRRSSADLRTRVVGSVCRRLEATHSRCKDRAIRRAESWCSCMATRKEFMARSRRGCGRRRAAPQEALAAKRRRREPRPANMLRGGRFSQGVLRAIPRPTHHAAHHRRRRRRARPRAARGGARPRLPARRRAERHPHHAGDPALRQGPRHRPAAAPPLLVPLRDPRPAQPRRALPDRAAPDSRATVRFASSRAPTSRTAGTTPTSGSPARTWTSGLPRRLLYGELLRAGGRRPRGPRRPHRQAAALLPLDRARGRDPAEYRREYALYRWTPRCELHAALPMVSIWDDHEVQNNYANDAPDGGLPLRAGSPARGATPPTRPWSESTPVSRAGARGSTARRRTADARPDDARRGPVPGPPALRRRDRAPVPQPGTAALDARPPSWRSSSKGAWRLQARVEGRGRAVADDAQPRPRRRAPALRLLARLPRSASTCCSTSSRRRSRTWCS